jgi:peroxiredoxin family protein
MSDNGRQKMAIIAARGTLDWAYPPYLLGSTGAAMGWDVQIFHTFYGLTLLKKKIKAKVSPYANPAMPMKMPFGPKGFQSIDWPIPNVIQTNVPGFNSLATKLMKRSFKKKNVAAVEEMREMTIDAGGKLIGCQMTMEVFGFELEEFIPGVEIAGAAGFLGFAADADVQLFI